MDITIDSAVASLNRHHIVYDKKIHSTVKNGIELEKYLTGVSCDHTYSAASAEVNDILQAYQCDFTPNNDVDFTAVDNTLERMKIDIVFECDQMDEFWDSWKVEWAEENTPADRKTFPAYIYNNHILPKLIENLDTVSFSGIYAPPTVGTAGLTINACTGIEKKIQDAVTAGKLTPIPTGVLVANTMVNQVETFCDAIPRPYRKMKGKILMSQTNADKYWRDYRAKFGTGNSNMGNDNNGLRVDNTKKMVIGVGTMDGSDGMIFIPDGLAAAIYGMKRGAARLPRIEWQKFERKVKGLADFSRFYGFKFWGHVFVNDQF